MPPGRLPHKEKRSASHFPQPPSLNPSARPALVIYFTPPDVSSRRCPFSPNPRVFASWREAAVVASGRLPKWQSPRPRRGPNRRKLEGHYWAAIPWGLPPGPPPIVSPAFSGAPEGVPGILTIPVVYTIVYNGGWRKPSNPPPEVSNSGQKGSKSVQTRSKTGLPILPNVEKTPLALAPRPFSRARRLKNPVFRPLVDTIVYMNHLVL